jgi:DNA-binding IclR family transcriptional regulator
MSGDPVSVPAKLLSVLDAYAEGSAAHTLSELSRRTGLPLTTTHRLVRELERWGGLERGDDGRYRIGLRMVEIAALCPRGTGLRDVALPFMQDLYEATHQNVQLAVREGIDGVYIERIAGRTAVPVRTRVGAHWPLHATGVGLALLAYAPPAVQEDVLTRPLKRFTPQTITDPGQLRRVLAEVRRTGVAISDRQIDLAAYSVGAPITGPDGACLAALSIVVNADDPSHASWGPAVRAAAIGISRQLRLPRARWQPEWQWRRMPGAGEGRLYRSPGDRFLVGARRGPWAGACPGLEQFRRVLACGQALQEVVGVDVDADGVGREVPAAEELRGGLAGGEVLGLELQPDSLRVFVVERRGGAVVDCPDGADALVLEPLVGAQQAFERVVGEGQVVDAVGLPPDAREREGVAEEPGELDQRQPVALPVPRQEGDLSAIVDDPGTENRSVPVDHLFCPRRLDHEMGQQVGGQRCLRLLPGRGSRRWDGCAHRSSSLRGRGRAWEP